MYVLRCADRTLYTGATNDLKRRLRAHNSGSGAKYVKTRRPAVLVASWEYPDRSTALRAEAAFKKLTRAEKLAHIQNPSSWRFP